MFLAVMALAFSLFGQPDPPTGASKRTRSGLPLTADARSSVGVRRVRAIDRRRMQPRPTQVLRNSRKLYQELVAKLGILRSAAVPNLSPTSSQLGEDAGLRGRDVVISMSKLAVMTA